MSQHPTHRNSFVARLAIGIALILVLSIGAAGPARAQRGGDRLSGLDGGALTQGELQQRDSIVVFWASWSPKCRDIVERLNRLHAKWNNKARVVSVNFQEDPAKVRLFLASREELNAPVFLDERGDFSKRHRVSSAPWLLVLKDGARVFSGKLSRDPNQVIEQASQ